MPTKRLPSRILMTADAVGGVWTYALELARALGAHGIKVELAVMGPPPSPSQRTEAAGLSNVTLHESTYALEWMDDPWQEVDRAGEWLLRLASATRPDLVHLNGYVHSTLEWNSPVVVVAHSCVCSWWWDVQGEMAPARYDEYRRRVSAGLAAADLVVAPTTAMLNELDKHYRVKVKGSVIYNARDPQLFSPKPKTPRILAAGRAWDPAKNFTVLNGAAPKVGWPIYLAGDCQHPCGGSAQFLNIHGLGKLDAATMRCQFAESTIYALPARYEPFGLSALEAGLSGCALVLGDIPSLREIWGDAATFVEPGDERKLAGALNCLIEDEAGRVEMGRRARTQAQMYTPARMSEGYLAAYHTGLETSLLEAAA